MHLMALGWSFIRGFSAVAPGIGIVCTRPAGTRPSGFFRPGRNSARRAFLCGFRARSLGVFFNSMIMAVVSTAVIKIGGVMPGLSPVSCIVWACIITVPLSSPGGLKDVLTEFIQGITAMPGALSATVFSAGPA
jgi:hypothetical protein